MMILDGSHSTTLKEEIKNACVRVTDLIPDLDTSGLTIGTTHKELAVARDVHEQRKFTRDPQVLGSIDTSDSEAYAWRARDALQTLMRENPERFASLRKRFEGRILIDLGSGNSEFGYQVALLLGASGYVAVDPFHVPGIPYTLSRAQKTLRNQPLIPFAAVPEDTLRFLKRLPRGSQISFLSSGTDDYIIESYDYRSNVIEELKRLLGPDQNAIIFNESIFGYQRRIGLQSDPAFMCEQLGQDRNKCIVYRAEEDQGTSANGGSDARQ